MGYGFVSKSLPSTHNSFTEFYVLQHRTQHFVKRFQSASHQDNAKEAQDWRTMRGLGMEKNPEATPRWHKGVSSAHIFYKVELSTIDSHEEIMSVGSKTYLKVSASFDS